MSFFNSPVIPINISILFIYENISKKRTYSISGKYSFESFKISSLLISSSFSKRIEVSSKLCEE